MKVYTYDKNGLYTGMGDITCATLSEGYTVLEPLPDIDGHDTVFKNNGWCYIPNTPEGMKLAGLIPLDDGDIIDPVNNTLTHIASPDRAHAWNGSNWIFSKELFASEVALCYDRIKASRENASETGFIMDGKYLVKSRVQDMTDAGAMFNQFMAGVIVSSEWHHSNGIVETVDKSRFLVIYQAMGAFRSAQFKKESELRELIADAVSIAELDSITW